MEKLFFRDNFGNAAEIDFHRGPAYQGGPSADHYRVTVRAAYDSDFVYHVSVYETLPDAQRDLMRLSCGTFKRILNNYAGPGLHAGQKGEA